MTPHTIQAAMDRGELDEEEAYFILRFAGAIGYTKAIRRLQDPVKRLRRWFICTGYETPELLQWDEGLPAWRWEMGITPLSFFDGRIVFNGPDNNKWVQFRVAGGYVMVSWNRSGDKEWWQVYWTPNGTPWHKGSKWVYDGLRKRFFQQPES